MDKPISYLIIIVLILTFSLSALGVGLSREKSAFKIHIDSVVVDTHNDTMMTILDDETWLPLIDIRNKTDKQIDIPKMRAGNLKVPFFAAYSSAYYGNPNKSVSRTLALINALYWTEKNNSDIFKIVHDYADIEKAIKEWKIAAVASIEGAYSLDNTNALELLKQYDDLGVKAIGFTWNYSNALGEGTYKAYADKTGTPSNGGLTDLGKQVVKEMNKLGMLVDVSHLSESSFYDVVNNSTSPIIASHSGVYALKAHERNLRDDQLKALAKNGGVVGIVFYPEFLTNKDKTYISDVVDHIDYAVKLIGVDHVGLGSDFDGATMPLDLKDSSQLYKITEELLRRGYREGDIKKILGQNTLRVIKEAERLKDEPNIATGIEITPAFEMGEITTDSTPLLTAKVKVLHGPDLDEDSLRVIVNGIPYKAKWDKGRGSILLQINTPLVERFYVVTFEVKNKASQIQRSTKIFYVK